MFRKLLIGATMLAALAVAAPAGAQTYDFNVSPGTVEAGGAVTASGQGCSPGAEVTIVVTEGGAQRAAGDVILTVTGTANENGEFSITFNIPPGTPVGVYTVT